MFDEQGRSLSIDLLSLKTVQMRTFHLTWFAFFLCFFGWFSHAPLMASTIGPDLGLTRLARREILEERRDPSDPPRWVFPGKVQHSHHRHS